MVIQHLAKVILMKQLLIKDNQYKSKSYFSEIKDVVDCIADKTLAELEKEYGKLERKKFLAIVRYVNMVGGVVILDFLSQEELKEKIKRYYVEKFVL